MSAKTMSIRRCMPLSSFAVFGLFCLFGSARAQQIKSAIPEVARPLPLSAVRLTGGPLKHAQDLDIDYLLKLEPDRMIAYYRKRAANATSIFQIPTTQSIYLLAASSSRLPGASKGHPIPSVTICGTPALHSVYSPAPNTRGLVASNVTYTF